MLAITRAKIKVSIKCSDQPEMWEAEPLRRDNGAMFSQAAGSGAVEQDSGCLALSRHVVMDDAC